MNTAGMPAQTFDYSRSEEAFNYAIGAPLKGWKTPRTGGTAYSFTPRTSFRCSESEREELPSTRNMTPRYDHQMGFYRDEDQNGNFISVASTPRSDRAPKVVQPRKVPRSLPKLNARNWTYDSIHVEWTVVGTYLPFGMYLCIDDGMNGPFRTVHYWSPADIAAHMRDIGYHPTGITITDLEPGTPYRITLCEGDYNFEPTLQPNHNITGIISVSTRAFAKIDKPLSKKKLTPWEPPGGWDAYHQNEASPTEKKTVTRFKDRFQAKGKHRSLQEKGGRLFSYQD